MFSKKYFQDRPILFLNLILTLGMIINVIAVALRVNTGQTVTIIRYQVNLGLAGFQRANTYQLYGFIIAAVIITAVAIFLSARLYKIKRSLSILILVLSIILLLFNLIVSGAILNLQ
jgi:hypothetical protein